MAAFSNFRNMYDVSLKPRLLRSLLDEQVPDDKDPSRSSLQLSYVVSIIRTHKLLSESFSLTTDEKIIKNWKSAFDDWIDRILKLVSSDMPDKCWAGVCLLGVTCRECSASRFLSSYSTWFNELLSQIQVSGGSQIVKVASCASTSDILTRLDGFPNAKKDGISHAGKLVQPILKLLGDDSSEAVLEAAASLLSTIITFFPSSVHRHYDNAETALVSKIMAQNCSPNLMKKLACCLAFLPKSRGDADSWSFMMQKILLLISLQLNGALEGLEEESKHNEVVMLLVPPGKDIPPLLGGSKDASNMSPSKADRLLVPTIRALMECCSTMFSSTYPVQVTVPVRPLLAILGRVLSVDGSLPQSLLPFTTARQQVFICSLLPDLHLHSLQVLAAMLKGVCSQLLPHAAEIVQLLTEYLKRCELSELRIKVYSIIKVLLISMGLGIALYLSQDIVNSAFVDLSPVNCESGGTSHRATFQSSAEATLQPCRKKRKHVTAGVSSDERDERCNGLSMEVEGPKDSSTSIALKIAALEAVEALLTVGGASGSDSWRSSIDKLLITIAMDACQKGWVPDKESILLPNAHKATWADLRLAALHALLASLLAPSRVRPPYLSLSLELFRKGKQATGTKLAEFCAHALLALELLIHPRALPLIDFPSPKMNTFNGFGGPEQNVPCNGGTLGMSSGDFDADDFLNYDYLENGDQFEDPMVEVDNVVNPESKETHKDQIVETPCIIEDLTAKAALKSSGQSRAPSSPDVEMQNSDVMSEHPEGHMKESGSHEVVTDFPLVSSSSVAQKEAGKGRADGIGGALDFLQTATLSTDIPSAIDTAHNVLGENMVATRADADTLKLSRVELHDESSSDSFPDIVDGDPDSD